MPMPSLPRRRFPWDVLLLVFEQADPSTLAVLGRVSLDFLRVTAPLLYKEVELKSVKQSEALFCEREVKGRKTKNSSPPSRVNPLLSLSQIRSLVIDLSFLLGVPDSDPPSISTTRFDSTDPLPLDNLEVYYQRWRHLKSPLSTPLYTCLLSHLNPTRCTYFAVVDADDPDGIWHCIGHRELAGWSRLQILDLYGFLPYTTLPSATDTLAGLPPASIQRRRVVRLHIASLLGPMVPDVEHLLREIGHSATEFVLDAMQPGSLVLVAHSEEERKESEEAVRTNEKIARWRSVFAVELAR